MLASLIIRWLCLNKPHSSKHVLEIVICIHVVGSEPYSGQKVRTFTCTEPICTVEYVELSMP